MSEDNNISLGSILNSITGRLAGDLAKAFTRRAANSKIAIALRDKLGLEKEHPEALDIFSETISRAHSQTKISGITLKNFLEKDINREKIFENIIEPMEESLVSGSDPEDIIAIFDIEGFNLQQRSELMQFIPTLLNYIREVRQKKFSPESRALLKGQEHITNQIEELKRAVSSWFLDNNKSFSEKVDDSQVPSEAIALGFLKTGKEYVIQVRMPSNLRGTDIDVSLRNFVKNQGTKINVEYLSETPKILPSKFENKSFFQDSEIKPLFIGSQVSFNNNSSGTLTAFIEISTGEPGILFPAHTIHSQQDYFKIIEEEFPIVQSTIYQKQSNLENTIAFLREIKHSSDSAIARLKYGTEFVGNIVPTGYGFPFEGQSIKYLANNADISLFGSDTAVYKIGGATGFTEGRISAIEVELNIPSLDGRLKFSNVLEISPLDNLPFCQLGDSGSLVFTRINDCLYALGMLFAMTSTGDAFCIEINKIMSEHKNIKWLS
jgi:Peptidase family S64